MKVLVLGQSGQVASHLARVLPDATYLDRATLDLAVPSRIAATIEAAAPQCVVNAAAYTAVDRAESEPELAWRINAEAPAAMARACAALDIPLVHISTDYVFAGDQPEPYDAAHSVGPTTVYGSGKLGGELAVRTLHPKHWILRTSWVFSEFGTNFVKTMLRLARERDALNVVADQRGRPTYAGDLAAAIAALIREPDAVPFGTHHATGGSAVSWHEFATEIIGRAHRDGLIVKQPAIRPIPTSDYPTPAKRPLNSVLIPSPSLARLARFDWDAGLTRTLAQLK